jgi:hypothetical protein
VEIVMPHLRRRPRLPRHQLDLWLASPLPELGGAPRWSALPDQTQRTLTSLLTRLLMAHPGAADQELGESSEGDSDER